MKIVPVIMAGGAGTRLWPLSREDKPKQFHNLSGRGSLLEDTIKRMLPLEIDQVLIATSKKYEKISESEIRKSGTKGTILSEPMPKNTSAAILYSAIYLEKVYEDSIMIVLPADHFMNDNNEFTRLLKVAVNKAQDGGLVTIGIKPTYPEIGYGYIKALQEDGEIRDVDRFVEKPNLEKAEEYLSSAQYFWNSGIFIWKTSVIMDYFKKLMPAHVNTFAPLMELGPEEFASSSDKVWEIKKEIFDSLESISIDYGILEKAENISVIPGDFGWADLGSWKAIDDILDPDDDGNRSPDIDKSIFVNSKNCSTFSEKKRISVVGLSNVVVVEAGDEILVIDKDASQDVRKVVEIVRNKK